MNGKKGGVKWVSLALVLLFIGILIVLMMLTSDRGEPTAPKRIEITSIPTPTESTEA